MTEARASFENTFFTTHLAQTQAKARAWDFARKIPSLPGTTAPLIEVLAPILSSAYSEIVLIPIDDHFLFRDLQTIGLRFEGYLVEGPADTEEFRLFDGPVKAHVMPLAGLNRFDHAQTKFCRIVLVKTDTLHHNLSFDADLYFEYCFNRERIISGISGNEWEPSHPGLVEKRLKMPSPAARAIRDFQEIIHTRKSSARLDRAGGLNRNVIETLLSDTYYRRPDRHLPCGTAGGMNSVRLFLVTAAINDLLPGVWSICAETTDWKKLASSLTPDLMFKAGLAQETYENCRCWIAVAYDLTESSQKYGTRAQRFALLHAGSLIQQLHLSATSLGIAFRALGGFDDGILSTMLNISPSKGAIAALVGLGGTAE